MSKTDELIARIQQSRTAEPYEIFECDSFSMLKYLLSALRKEVLTDECRFEIVRELGLNREWGKKDRGEDIAKALIHITKNDSDENVRSVASDALSSFIDFEGSLDCLESVAANSEEIEFVRTSAIGGIRGGYFTAKRMKMRRQMKACVSTLEKLRELEDIAPDVDIELDIIQCPDDDERG